MEDDRAFGEEGSEVMLQNVKKVDGKLMKVFGQRILR